MGICILIFCGYGISLTLQKEEEEKSEEADTQLLFELESGDIFMISYAYDEEMISLEQEGDEWEYANDANFALNQSLAEEMATTLTNIEVTQMIQETDVDLESFGLDTPNHRISFITADGSSHELLFGNYNTAADAYYTLKNDDGCVYMVKEEVKEAFSYKLYDLLVLDEIPQVEADYVSKITVCDGENTTEYTYKIEEMEQESDESEGEESEEASSQIVWYAWNGTESTKCDSTQFAEFTEDILGITATQAADYHAGSTENLANTYGISEKFIMVSYVDADTDEEQSYVLYFGNSDGAGNVYMTVNDSMQVLLVEESLVNRISGNRILH